MTTPPCQGLLAGVGARAERPAMWIRVGEEMSVGLEADARPEGRLAVKPDHPARPPEVPAREGDHLSASGERPRELERGVVGIRAAQPEEDAVEARWRDRDERLLEGDSRFAHRRRRDVADAPGLVADRGDDLRMGMADGRGREARR